MKKKDVSHKVNDAENTQNTSETKEERAAKAAAAMEEMLNEEGKEDECEQEGVDPKDQQIKDLQDRLVRNMAEFDNFRKRTEKEKANMFDMGARSIVEKLLPTIDNFERALKSVPEGKECESFVAGMDMIYKQLLKELEAVGVKPIKCVGHEFDPNFHNAVMHVEDESVGDNIVVEEFQRGYTYKDAIVRHSMVKVAN